MPTTYIIIDSPEMPQAASIIAACNEIPLQSWSDLNKPLLEITRDDMVIIIEVEK